MTAAPATLSSSLKVSAARESIAVGKRVALTLPAEEETSVRILARGGEVRLEKGVPVFAPQVAGEHDVTVVTMREGQSLAGRVRVIAK